MADPVKFFRTCWPMYTLYKKQEEILYSVRDNYETIVPAGNQLGKDFIAGACILWFLVSRRPSRCTTTSVNATQLEDVLWSEIRNFVEKSVVPLPIQILHNHIYQVDNFGKRIPKCEVVAKVVKKDEGMLGLHADRTKYNEPTTMLVVDEASGVEDGPYEKASTWAHRKLVIGNPFQCRNFFFRGVLEGDLPSVKGDGSEILQRKVIRIKATDSPNVRLGLAETRSGKSPSHRIPIPGIITYATYLQRRATYDKVLQCVSLDGEFYLGATNLLFPPEWLNLAERTYQYAPKKRKAKAIGIDPAEGGDSTCYAAIDEFGLIELVSIKTPDTSKITSQTLGFMRSHGLNPDDPQDCRKVIFDRGGGGKQHSDRLRAEGYDMRTVGFGEAATKPITHGADPIDVRRREAEQRYAYKNKRAEMYGRLRLRMDPTQEDTQFSFSPEETELRRQLAPIPLLYDEEGRMKLPPKKKKKGVSEESLEEMLGCSPDEADAVAMAVYALEVADRRPIIGMRF